MVEKWSTGFLYTAGVFLTITVWCIVIGVALQEFWGITNIFIFYDVVARMFLVSMILLIPFCVAGIYWSKKRRNQRLSGGKE